MFWQSTEIMDGLCIKDASNLKEEDSKSYYRLVEVLRIHHRGPFRKLDITKINVFSLQIEIKTTI